MNTTRLTAEDAIELCRTEMRKRGRIPKPRRIKRSEWADYRASGFQQIVTPEGRTDVYRRVPSKGIH